LNLQTLSLRGDLNGDLIVSDGDVEILLDNVGMSNPTLANGDFNGDGQINQADMDFMFAQYGLALDVVS
jgi:hypothetical protein